ncbi:MAG: cyclopropane-fatty-acyl-phospholipid synthase family protein [Salaquimonas sp.]
MRLLSNLMNAFVKKGELTIIDVEGKHHLFSGSLGPSVTFKIHDKSLYKSLVFNPELAAGEAYMDGTLTFEEGTSVRDFLKFYSINSNSLADHKIQKIIRKIKMPFRKLQQSNKKVEATKNVSHHYDLGNDFYKLFLDKNMLYSCAYFRSENDTLEEAQRNKLRLLAAKLDLRPGQKILDIGCGWGDLALYLASIEKVQVVGVTLSTEQQKLATERAEKMGLTDRVTFKLLDYRDVDGPFDRIVSVGMFEHVGVHHYDEFFQKVNSLIPDNGLAVIHSIGHMSPPSMASPWLRKYIFPGAYSPALSEVYPVLERNKLWVLDMEFLRLHYALTLNHWWQRFDKNRAKVVEMYDERFARMWEFYLISCEIMFETGAQMVFHAQISRNRLAAPIQRDYIVEKQKEYEALEKKMKLVL